jgi:hypothetical protein
MELEVLIGKSRSRSDEGWILDARGQESLETASELLE